MAHHPAEENIIRAFVVSARRDRLLALFASAKRRKQAADTLDHFADWDPKWAQSVPSSANVAAVLQRAGASKNCHLISDEAELDGRDLPLQEAASRRGEDMVGRCLRATNR